MTLSNIMLNVKEEYKFRIYLHEEIRRFRHTTAPHIFYNDILYGTTVKEGVEKQKQRIRQKHYTTQPPFHPRR